MRTGETLTMPVAVPVVDEVDVRETRHIQGDFLLTLHAIYHQVEFPDRIGRGSHPIDSYPRPL